MDEIDRRIQVRENWQAGVELMVQGRFREGFAAAFSAKPFMEFRDIEWLLEEVAEPFQKSILTQLRQHVLTNRQQRIVEVEAMIDSATEPIIDATVATIAIELGDRWNSTSDEKVIDLAKRAAERGDPVAKVFASPDPAGLSKIEAKRLMLKRLLEARTQWPKQDHP